jgi:hypothetical protein
MIGPSQDPELWRTSILRKQVQNIARTAWQDFYANDQRTLNERALFDSLALSPTALAFWFLSP